MDLSTLLADVLGAESLSATVGAILLRMLGGSLSEEKLEQSSDVQEVKIALVDVDVNVVQR